jgi:predicted secreted acid phosphatase
LNDFEQEFEKQDMATRAATADRKQALFGRRYILLPNAIYGEWEDALTDYKRLEGAERKAKLKHTLREDLK